MSEPFDCDSCGEPTDRIIFMEVALDILEPFAECDACRDEALEAEIQSLQ